MANKLRNKADTMRQLAKKNPDVTIWFKDAGDMEHMAGMVEQGDFWSALEFAQNRDTEFRESVPNDVWNYLVQNNS